MYRGTSLNHISGRTLLQKKASREKGREVPRSEVEERPPRPPTEEAEVMASLTALSRGRLWSAMEVEAKVSVLDPRKSWNKSLSCSIWRRWESTSVVRSSLLWFTIIKFEPMCQCVHFAATSSITVCSLYYFMDSHNQKEGGERERERSQCLFWFYFIWFLLQYM